MYSILYKAETDRTYVNYQDCFVLTPKVELSLLSKSLKIDLDSHCKEVSKELLGPFYVKTRNDSYYLSIYESDLKYCPICMKHGFHSVFHQLTFFDKCLIHGVDLLDNCPNCFKKIPYKFKMSSYQRGYTC